MKFDKMTSLSWSVFVAVLLVFLGTASIDMVSAVPTPASADGQPSIRVRGQYPTGFPKGQPTRDFPEGHFPAVPTSIETVRIAVPTKGSFRFPPPQIGLPVETPVRYKRQDGDIFKTVPESHATDPLANFKQRDLLPSTATTSDEEPESESESESVDGVELSKRRAMPNSWIKWIGSGGFNQRRDLPSTLTTATPEMKSGSVSGFESESAHDVGLSKRRMQVVGAIRYVNPADVRKRDLPSSPSTTNITPEEESEPEFESVDDSGLSKRRMQVVGAIRYVNPADVRKRDLPSSASTTNITPEEESESESEKDVELSKRRWLVQGKVEFVGHPKYN